MVSDPGLFYGAARPQVPDPGGRLPVAVIFPGPERLALSTLGWQIVYRLLAGRPEFCVDRFFVDPRDPAQPRGQDSGRPLSDFALLAVSLNFEEETAAVVRLLTAAGLPPRRTEREGWPLVLVGGPLAVLNPAPLAPAVDLFWLGEAEAGLTELALELHKAWLAGCHRETTLEAVCRRPGVYVPGLSPTPVRRAVAGSHDRRLETPGFSCFVSPRAEFADMLLLEVNRGCPYGCRFCAAGTIYRPPRHAQREDLQALVEMAAPRKVGLVGTALTDWPELPAFLEWLRQRKIAFGLSSLRADGLTPEFLGLLRRSGVRTITLALEGASHRLRVAANKKLDEADLLRAVELCASLGVNHLKLYCILGWPGETDADYAELGEFLVQIQEARQRGRGGRAKGLELITLSLSCLVPKPWTPFQWAPMASEEALASRIRQVRELVRPLKGMRVDADAPAAARLQGLIARGDAALFELIAQAAQVGWKHALAQWPGEAAAYLDRERGAEEAFPWEVVDLGVGRRPLWREWQAYGRGVASPVCPSQGCLGCRRCGVETWLPAPGC